MQVHTHEQKKNLNEYLYAKIFMHKHYSNYNIKLQLIFTSENTVNKLLIASALHSRS